VYNNLQNRMSYLIANPPHDAPAATVLSGSIWIKDELPPAKCWKTARLWMFLKEVLPSPNHIVKGTPSPILSNGISEF
jgi:hypothetical protein